VALRPGGVAPVQGEARRASARAGLRVSRTRKEGVGAH
jgi:hypothetical protein